MLYILRPVHLAELLETSRAEHLDVALLLIALSDKNSSGFWVEYLLPFLSVQLTQYVSGASWAERTEAIRRERTVI